jgi:hypothetical protein
MQQTQGRRGDAATLKSRQAFRETQVIVRLTLLAALAAVAFLPHALAQDEATEKAIEKYRAMLKEDPWSNPGFLDVDRGEALWTTAAGPKKATMEQCDLGKGPGKVEGAFAELPRYFADADRVMDVETRLLWCMEKLQGISAADYVKRPHPGGGQPVKDLGAMATVCGQQIGGPEVRRAARPRERARDGRARRDAVPSPLRPVRFRLRDLSRQFRPAHPPAGPALSRGEEGGRQGDRRMAGLSRVDHACDDDAAPHV